MVKVKLSQGESDTCLGANGKQKLATANAPAAPTLTHTTKKQSTLQQHLKVQRFSDCAIMAAVETSDADLVSTALGRLDTPAIDNYIVAFGPNGRQFIATPNGYSA